MRLEWETLELRTRYAFHIARLAGAPVRRNVWVRIRDEDGLEGWGEAAANVFYGETGDTVSALMPLLARTLEEASEDPFALDRIEAALERAIGRNPAARASISMALHDLLGKRLELPVWKLWGLDPERAPRSSFTIGIDELERMRERVRDAAGYPILKIKVGTERDEEVLRMIREEAPDVELAVDANTAWNARQALERIAMLRDYGVSMVEQPLEPDDLEGFRLLYERSPLPIVADESCRTAADVPRLVGRVDGINVKLAKCGSLREAIRLVHVARAHGMRVMLGCMVESTLAISAAVQVAPLVDHADLDGAALLANDPFAGPGLEPDGSLRFNREPGLGVTPAS